MFFTGGRKCSGRETSLTCFPGKVEERQVFLQHKSVKSVLAHTAESAHQAEHILGHATLSPLDDGRGKPMSWEMSVKGRWPVFRDGKKILYAHELQRALNRLTR